MRELGAFSEMAKAMVAKPLPRALQEAVEKGAEIMENKRCCFIELTKEAGFTLAAGYPPEGHDIGQKITNERSITLLVEVMRARTEPLIIKNPLRDPRTCHLKWLIEKHHITAMVFMPLRSKEEAFGVMVFDFTSEIRKTAEEIKEIAKVIGDFISFSIAYAGDRKKEEIRIIRIERIRSLTENSRRIAHETCNIFTAVGGHAKRLHDKVHIHEDAKDHARIICEMTQRAEKMLKGVLEFASYSSQGLEMENQGIGEFLKNTATEALGLCKKAKINLRNESRDTVLCFNKKELGGCFSNIILNADQAGAHTIWMRYEVKPKTKQVLITITNDGPAIDKDDLKDIFSPFFTTKENGSGVGLSLTKAIIEEGHGGTITAENRICKSTRKNRTIFKIYLPM